ncbi:MAG: hypothetical protein N2Z63_04470 [Thiobacillaceae bacterium]|nr:hypothetical protein [Thiobacillaceae bacterium]
MIARFGNLAELFPAEEASGHAGIFVIEVNTDEPPRPLAWVKHPTDPRWDLLLNTTELVKHLAMIATSLRAKQDPEDMGLPAAARDTEYGVMLHRLKLSWGASVQRQAQRRRYQRGKEIEVCLGLRALHQLIGPVGAERVVAPAGAESAPALLRCQVVDDSMGGVAIRRSGGFAVPVRVGEVVGLRQGSSGWSVGLVRWFRVPTAGELYFGIQLLAPKVETVQVRRGDDGKHYPGLLLQPAPALKQSTILLLPPGSLSPGLEVELCSQSGPRAVKLDKRLEYTSSVDVFRLAQD